MMSENDILEFITKIRDVCDFVLDKKQKQNIKLQNIIKPSVYHYLRIGNITTLEQLLNTDIMVLKQIRGVGPRMISKIRDALNAHGFKLLGE